MSAEPAVPTPDDKDWTWVLGRRCPDCAFDASAMDRADIGTLVEGAVATLTEALARPDARDRPEPAVWSPLEYGCHVRDVCTLFDERLQLMLSSDDPFFANWDQDETALAERYWEQDPAVVARELAAAASGIVASFAVVDGDQWDRPSRRSGGSVFTVDTFARYFLHDLVHHAHDVSGSAR